MAAFCTCCGAEITLKAEACPACGAPRHGMLRPDSLPGLDIGVDLSQDLKVTPKLRNQAQKPDSKRTL